MTHASHEFLRAGTRGGCEGVAGVPEIVKTQSFDPDRPQCAMPSSMKRRRPERSSGFTGKHEVLGAECRPHGEVCLEVGADDGRMATVHRPSVGLRRTEHECPVDELLVLLHDVDRSMNEIEVGLAQRSQLSNRSPQEVASKTIARYRGSMASATANTWSIVADGRSAGQGRGHGPKVLAARLPAGRRGSRLDPTAVYRWVLLRSSC